MHPQDPMTAPRVSRTALQATQYEVFRRKRALMASFMIFVLIPATMVFGVVVLDGRPQTRRSARDARIPYGRNEEPH